MSLSYQPEEGETLVIAGGFRAVNQIQVGVECPPEEARTKQSFADECDINNIVKRYQDTGVLPHTRGEPQYGECPSLDFKEALDYVRAARTEFDELRPELKSKFENFDHYLNVLSIEQEQPDVFRQLMAEKLGSSDDESEPSKSQNEPSTDDD